MQVSWSVIADKIAVNIEDILLVIIILAGGFVVGRAVGRIIGIIMRRSGILSVLKGPRAKGRTSETSITLIAFIEAVIRWTIYLIAVGQAINILGLEDLNRATSNVVTYLPNVVVALVIMVVGFVAADRITEALEEYFRESNLPRSSVVLSFVRYFVYIVAIIMALAQMRISTQVLIVIAGSVSLFAAIFLALGAKDLAHNFFSGLQILWYRSIKVGDIIEVDGVVGVVEEIQLLNTTLKTPENAYVIVPNGKIANGFIYKK
jgi:small-conductance mechanosensitive channel